MGTMVFILPESGTYEVRAEEVDRPITLCRLVNAAAERLSSRERRMLVDMLLLLDLGRRPAKEG